MADHHDHDHVPGTMDIHEQERTFAGFLKACVIVGGLGLFVAAFLGACVY